LLCRESYQKSGNPSASIEVKDRILALPKDEVYLSALTLGELIKGIELLPPGRKRDGLQAWYDGLVIQFAKSILPVNLQIAERWGDLSAASVKRGRLIGLSDGLLAATALHHGFSVVTRNTKDFEDAGVRIYNPWLGSHV
jgi:predicted nucleic acid-binding protein